MQVRGHVEAQLSLIAAGKAEKGAVVLHTLAQFAHKFRFFVSHIARMDALFEASFSPLSSSGEDVEKNLELWLRPPMLLQFVLCIVASFHLSVSLNKRRVCICKV